MTTLDRIEVTEDGTIFIRFRKDDGGWHRTSIPPNADPDTQLNAVDQHLLAMGMTRARLADRTIIKERCSIEHTAEVRQRFRERMERSATGQRP